MSSEKLKSLQRQLDETVQGIKNLEEERKRIDGDLKKKILEKSFLRKEVERLKAANNGPIVSEHAMLRYFERVMGYDLEEVRNTILPPDVNEKIRLLGNGIYPVYNSHRLRVKDGKVITILNRS